VTGSLRAPPRQNRKTNTDEKDFDPDFLIEDNACVVRISRVNTQKASFLWRQPSAPFMTFSLHASITTNDFTLDGSKRHCEKQRSTVSSVVTPNPANGGHLKTGQWESNQDKP